MIETKEALEKLDEILDTSNLDGIYIGPADLSLAVGEEPGFDKAKHKSLQRNPKNFRCSKKREFISRIAQWNSRICSK